MGRIRRIAEIVLFAELTATTSCTVASSHRVLPVATPADTTLFFAVARAIQDSAKYPLEIDPRPLDTADVNVPSASHRSPISPGELRARETSLRRLGIPSAAADLPRRCASVRTETEGDNKAECPRTSSTIAEIGLARTKSFYAPATVANYRAVRAPQLTIGPDGVIVEIWEYILVATPQGGWMLVWAEPVQWVE